MAQKEIQLTICKLATVLLPNAQHIPQGHALSHTHTHTHAQQTHTHTHTHAHWEALEELQQLFNICGSVLACTIQTQETPTQWYFVLCVFEVKYTCTAYTHTHTHVHIYVFIPSWIELRYFTVTALMGPRSVSESKRFASFQMRR